MKNKVIVIKPRESLAWSDIEEIWEYRELLLAFVKRDLKVRYKQTVIGVLWALIQPLLIMLVFTVMFQHFASSVVGIPYPIFSYLGLVLWTYFTSAISGAANSLVGDTSLITKVYFPRLIIPLATTIVGLVDLGIALMLMLGLFIWFHLALPATALLGILIIFGMWVFTFGLGAWLAAVSVKYHDVKYIIPFFLQLGIFLSPVIYPLSDAPRLRLLLSLSPMTGYIEAWRSALLGLPIDFQSLGIALIVTLLILLGGLRYFRSVERYFADII